ncbi:MAG TPA: hypothetical protein ENN19_16195 [Chloroflexi bacterium]|nr:hypothetical protein [Chloroflexota bacterium]
MLTSPPVEIPSVLRHKLGEDGATALTGLMESFWQGRVRESEDTAWRRTDERLDRVEARVEQLAEAQQRTEAQVSKLLGAIDTLRLGHRIHPTAQEAAEALGILLVGSYQR